MCTVSLGHLSCSLKALGDKEPYLACKGLQRRGVILNDFLTNSESPKYDVMETFLTKLRFAFEALGLLS